MVMQLNSLSSISFSVNSLDDFRNKLSQYLANLIEICYLGKESIN